MERVMPTGLAERILASNRELEGALRLTEDPGFDVRVLDVAVVRRLQEAVADVARASAEASNEERERARSGPAYRIYLENLARLGAILDVWNERLLAYRAQLDRDGEHLRAARNWAEAYNRTR
jgi:hypothetical protein